MLANVVVVGAGPAGSATALALARRGIDVQLVERAVFPRPKVCGEYLNIGAVRLLDELGVGAAVRAVASPLRGVRLVSAKVDPVVLPFPGEALALAREQLDLILLDAARAAGARVQRGRVEDLVFEGDRVSGVSVRNEAGERHSIAARFVVGADGVGSLVARKMGVVRASGGPRRFAVGGHYDGFSGLDQHVEMHVAPGTYFAINPLDSRRANVMIVVRDRALSAWAGAVDSGVSALAAKLGCGRRSFEGTQRIGERLSIGPLAFDVSAVARPGALLVGDAAGFLNPFTGQGVYLALRSAQDAAMALLAALERPELEPHALAQYSHERTHDVRARRRLAWLTGMLIDVPWMAARAASRVARSPELAEHLLAALGGATAREQPLSPLLAARLLA
ncbi:MAG TPA: FAD-dependent oxidoreductase [Candidatus Baltobacteraceae bacterium]